MRKGETADGVPGTSAERGEKTQVRRGQRERRKILKEKRKYYGK